MSKQARYSVFALWGGDWIDLQKSFHKHIAHGTRSDQRHKGGRIRARQAQRKPRAHQQNAPKKAQGTRNRLTATGCWGWFARDRSRLGSREKAEIPFRRAGSARRYVLPAVCGFCPCLGLGLLIGPGPADVIDTTPGTHYRGDRGTRSVQCLHIFIIYPSSNAK